LTRGRCLSFSFEILGRKSPNRVTWLHGGPQLYIGFRLAALSPTSGFAEPERAIVPLKPAAVPERRLELPFDLKTEPNIKFRGPDNVPAALVPTKEHKPFVGFGLSRPLEVPK
jgi:hypothetical protein